MILTDKQEQLSLAVLHATCARAGFAYHLSHRIQDNWGWDAHADVKERFEPTSTLFNFRLRFQLKATRQQLIYANGRYSFPLEVKHYNDFRVSGWLRLANLPRGVPNAGRRRPVALVQCGGTHCAAMPSLGEPAKRSGSKKR